MALRRLVEPGIAILRQLLDVIGHEGCACGARVAANDEPIDRLTWILGIREVIMRHHDRRRNRFEAAIGKGLVVRRSGVRIGERVGVIGGEHRRTVSGEIDGAQADAILPAEAQFGHGAGRDLEAHAHGDVRARRVLNGLDKRTVVLDCVGRHLARTGGGEAPAIPPNELFVDV